LLEGISLSLSQMYTIFWLKEVDECLGEGLDGLDDRCDLRDRLTSKLKN
jgi:hypothetical protein